MDAQMFLELFLKLSSCEICLNYETVSFFSSFGNKTCISVMRGDNFFERQGEEEVEWAKFTALLAIKEHVTYYVCPKTDVEREAV